MVTTPVQAISETSPYGVFVADLQPGGLGRSRRRLLRGAMDHLSRQAAQPFHGRGAQAEGVLLYRGLAPCPTLYQRKNKMGDGLDAMKYYKQASKIRHAYCARALIQVDRNQTNT